MSAPPLNFFAKKAFFPITSEIGKPLTVDMETKNQTRPSCARIKVQGELVDNLLQRVRINEEDDVTGEIKFKWMNIEYYYKPRY